MAPGGQSIVNELIRAAASIPQDITDAELDKHVAELLVKEAKEKESRFRELGIGVYLDSVRQETSIASALPKPNKRFLSSVIRQVDGHNTALLREQALAAQDASRELLPPPGRDGERNRRDDRGSMSSRSSRPAGAARLFGGALGAARTSKSRQSEVEREREHDDRQNSRSQREERGNGRRDREHGGRHDTVGRADSRRHAPDRLDHEGHEVGKSDRLRDDRDKGKRREPSERRSRSPRARRESSPLAAGNPVHAKQKNERTDPLESNINDGVARPIQSKMDRYFDEAYNPQLDFTGVLPIPADGLVPDVGWDNMLAVLKEKGKKKRAASPGFSPSPPPTASHRRQRSVSPTRTDKRRESERSSRHKSKGKDKTKKKNRHRSQSPLSEQSPYDSEDSEARERRRRKRRKEKERRKAEEEEEDKKKFGGYVYARPGSTRDWDVGKVDMSF